MLGGIILTVEEQSSWLEQSKLPGIHALMEVDHEDVGPLRCEELLWATCRFSSGSMMVRFLHLNSS